MGVGGGDSVGEGGDGLRAADAEEEVGLGDVCGGEGYGTTVWQPAARAVTAVIITDEGRE